MLESTLTRSASVKLLYNMKQEMTLDGIEYDTKQGEI